MNWHQGVQDVSIKSQGTISGRDPLTGRSLRVAIEKGRIASVDATETESALWLSPGFVDLQVNGYGGHDFNSGNVDLDHVDRAAAAVFATGTTTFLPTVVTTSEEAIIQAVGAIAAARRRDEVLAAATPCIHIEGPFIGPQDGPRGAHERKWVRPPDIAEFDRWQQACDGLIGLVTLSPHWPGSVKFIAHLAKRGIIAAIGHTDATPEEVTAAVDAGASLSTHLGNAAVTPLQRHPNFIWTQLADDRLSASFIGDGQHLPASTLQAMIRAKGFDRSILISDAIALAGLPPGIYDSPIGGRVEVTEAGGTSVVGTPYFAGAIRPLRFCIATAANLSGVNLADALLMATQTPGRLLERFAKGRGTLVPGAPADLVSFAWSPGDNDLDLAQILVAGNEVELPQQFGTSETTNSVSANARH